ncbi:hypothetical protein GCM10008955_01750 [Deinococcus malanensis]|uniref:Uncharacterized protein n=2 Tax=Deinococcus malanensis TaxID=1706855 RepID=A0ABQ2EH11_9DEIO|nr:hypothetical protein GCM10008955_01750 [Deinococcus malanensis]
MPCGKLCTGRRRTGAGTSLLLRNSSTDDALLPGRPREHALVGKGRIRPDLPAQGLRLPLDQPHLSAVALQEGTGHDIGYLSPLSGSLQCLSGTDPCGF